MKYLALIALILITAACTETKNIKFEYAKRIAGPAFMIEREALAGNFVLTLFERVHAPGKPAHIYIEADDASSGLNPTPKEPIGLRLASIDKSPNVIYAARPCQYGHEFKPFQVTPSRDRVCETKYSKTHRFAPEVLQSYMALLDSLKARYGFTSFRIIGHSGGGAIGALLAAERSDITSLTTISGLLDNDSYTRYLRDYRYAVTEDFNGSLNAASIARKIADLPQIHYRGGTDDITPPETLNTYLQASGNFHSNRCIKTVLIQDNGYMDGWANKWKALLKDIPSCRRT